MQMPLVSVIMNCYNSDAFLREALDSALNQSYKNIEIIFWDNQSTDSSAEIVKSYKDERIRYFLAPTFSPLYAARNFAIEQARGEYIAFLDCDDAWLSDKLQKQVKAMQSGDYGFCYSNSFSLKNGIKKPLMRSKRPSGDIFAYQIALYSIDILTVMLKKSAYDKMSEKFDENLNYPGDFEFFIRFLKDNRAIYIDECLAIYRSDNANSITHSNHQKNMKELEYAINKLESKFSSAELANSFYQLRACAVCQRVRFCYKNNDLKTARKWIAPYKFARLKNFIWYILTFLPLRLSV